MNESKPKSTPEHDWNEERIVLLIRFNTKPGQLEEFVQRLTEVVELMRLEASFVDAVISQNVDRPNELLMYETWLGSRESWLRDELPRPYRAQYEGALAQLVESRGVEWFTPLTSWHSRSPEEPTNTVKNSPAA